MLKTIIEKWSNEQREIQSQTIHSSRTKILVDFMRNYTDERIYVDIPDNVSCIRVDDIRIENCFRHGQLMNQHR
jgi:hypothetical protein